MRYHYQIGFPKTLSLPTGIVRLTYSYHALNKGVDSLPDVLNTTRARLIEVETDFFGKVLKVVYRVPYNAVYDLVLAVLPNGFVKTVWLNGKYDNHATLNKNLYCCP